VKWGNEECRLRGETSYFGRQVLPAFIFRPKYDRVLPKICTYLEKVHCIQPQKSVMLHFLKISNTQYELSRSEKNVVNVLISWSTVSV
jgi:hypothetical protein